MRISTIASLLVITFSAFLGVSCQEKAKTALTPEPTPIVSDQKNSRDASSLFGDWTGESKCVGNNSYCHDEIVVYHVSRSKKDAAFVNISADKIVNGKPDFMGEFDMVYDAAKQTLTSEFQIPRTGGKGVWLFHIDGDKMDGTLTVMPEN